MADWYSKKISEVFEILKTSEKGLSAQIVAERLLEYGPNSLPKGKERSFFYFFTHQFVSPLIYILVFVSIVSFVLGHRLDAGVILFIVIINAFIGAAQEKGAQNIIKSLAEKNPQRVTVIRGGEEKDVLATELVPGDILTLSAGTKVPADVRIIEINNLKVSEASLTGESVPVNKTSRVLSGENLEISQQKNMVFAGTIITFGTAKTIVVATGERTELGKIAKTAESVNNPKTPLEIKIEEFAKFLAKIVLIVSLGIFLIGLLLGLDPLDIFFTSVALAVSAIPEGLPLVITFGLTVGVRLMAKENAVVKNLSALETLGMVDTICTDKTGTLTQNKISVEEVATFIKGEGLSIDVKDLNFVKSKSIDQIFYASVMASSSKLGSLLADPTEVAILEAAKERGITREEILLKEEQIAEIPFDSKNKYMASINKTSDPRFWSVYIKGAPEKVFEMCEAVYQDGKTLTLTKIRLSEITEHYHQMARSGLRVLAVAQRRIPKNKVELADKGMVLLGLIGMMDLPRKEIKSVIQVAQSAGIRTIMATGDHHLTSMAIADQVGLPKIYLEGSKFSGLKEKELSIKVEDVSIYSRLNPLHKLKIVSALKENGHIVAMTGDGINDAVALKASDIGIAMGKQGTDVTKEAADIVLLDDNYATLVKAIKNGRAIYDNLKRVISYLISSNLGEVMTIFFSLFFLSFYPLPVLPLQILWINLITDSIGGFPLLFEKPHDDIMHRKPRSSQDPIFSKEMQKRAFLVGIVMALGTLSVYYLQLYYNDSLQHARTLAFMILVFAQLANTLNIRSAKYSIFSLGFKHNPYVLPALLLAVIIQLSLVYNSKLQLIFSTAPLTLIDWLKILVVSSLIIVIIELRKRGLRRKGVQENLL